MCCWGTHHTQPGAAAAACQTQLGSTLLSAFAGILVEAFSPLLPITAGLQSEGALALMAEVDRVAAAHSVTPAQVR
jgi:diketogulonate reductase-like aldo/keto reductase